jgi:hypothetical protein
MERTKKRTQSLLANMVEKTGPLMRSMARAYSHHGHGPRADQTGRIHISDFRNPAKPQLHPAAGPYILASFARYGLTEITTALPPTPDIEPLTSAFRGNADLSKGLAEISTGQAADD